MIELSIPFELKMPNVNFNVFSELFRCSPLLQIFIDIQLDMMKASGVCNRHGF